MNGALIKGGDLLIWGILIEGFFHRFERSNCVVKTHNYKLCVFISRINFVMR